MTIVKSYEDVDDKLLKFAKEKGYFWISMNEYLKNLNRIEFVVTLACTGKCKHCSEGEHISNGMHIDGVIATNTIHEICKNYNIQSLMTFSLSGKSKRYSRN